MRPLLYALICAGLALGCGKKADPPTPKKTTTKKPPQKIVPKTVNFCGKSLVIETTEKAYCRDQGVVHASSLRGFRELRLLDVSTSKRLKGLDQLAVLPALRELTVYKTEVDLTQVAKLTRLRELKIIKAPYAKNLDALAGLLGLTYLRCSHCAVAKVAFLAKLTRLKALSLSHSSSIREGKAIGTLGELRFLNLSGTGISDLSWISGLKKLEKLYLAGTKVKNLKPLVGVTALRSLNLASTAIRDISVLPKLKNLDSLNLTGNPRLRRLAPLRKMTWLKTLTVTSKVVSGRRLARLQKALPRTRIRAR